ncbi:uncharacterized protein I303_102784 [Kwoniella dejecticola CBS 10117]|uniref:GAR domain-containing protein n=1 Tax=Kwoniella dejecticola CBS 10117 TaxID=1296121 RepID=A0A1A6A9Q4_9TREE|nr:uncharacterized protein I303_02799 [Kwoniella dejecticola CBS 10117]OBR86784.1 hypothetical protein I303_02799 [Kwoniella dejecticola CBS 10117]
MSTASDEELASIAQNISLNDGEVDSLQQSLPKNDIDIMTNDTNDSSDHTPSSGLADQNEHPEHNPTSGVQSRKSSSSEVSDGGVDSPHKAVEKRMRSLSHEVALLLDRIYEIQELRHSSVPSTSSAQSAPSRIDNLLSSLSDSTLLLRPQITSLSSSIAAQSGSHTQELQEGLEVIMEDWKKVEDQQKWLLEEMKEDGWLIRFRTTADQAEAMMDPLQKSLVECQTYLKRMTNPSADLTSNAEFDDHPSIEHLRKLTKGHESMTSTYVPSINKIIKTMDKSISDRPIKNGESLRRLSEMSQRWAALQKQLQQLSARTRIVISQRQAEMEYLDSGEDIELLADIASPYSSNDSRSDYFGQATIKSRESTSSSYGSSRTRLSYDNNPARSHSSSVSSGISTTSTRSPRQSLPRTHTSPSVKGTSTSTLSPDAAMKPLPLRRRTSMLSTASSTTARNPTIDRPRWNSSPKVPAETTQTQTQTPIHPRRPNGLPRSVSPTPSNTSVTSTMSRRLSRIPVASPTAKFSGYASPPRAADDAVSLPGLTVSNSHSRTLLAEPSSVNRNQSHLERARMSLKTPEPPRPRLSSTFSSLSRGSNTPTMGNRAYSSGSTTRTAPVGRTSMGGSRGAPPSSFRITSPTPSGAGAGPGLSRPSSRLSVMSYSNFNTTPDDLKEFVPSKYDLLDQEIQTLLEETEFRLFVSRLDEALKRGQRRNENDEWKGEFVFGPPEKEKPTSVKLLTIAGARPGTAKRTKCLIRYKAQWVDLKTELDRRMRDYKEYLADDETF